jgi:hypothetical protein
MALVPGRPLPRRQTNGRITYPQQGAILHLIGRDSTDKADGRLAAFETDRGVREEVRVYRLIALIVYRNVPAGTWTVTL